VSGLASRPVSGPVTPTRRAVLAGLSALALAPVVAACGSEPDEAGETTPSPQPSASAASGATTEAAFPATITHTFGETTVERAPTRVVCVGYTEQDALLALGIAPVAVTKWFGDAEAFIFPWARDLLGDAPLPEVLENTNGVEVEKIAALQPDLIIGQYAGLTRKEYDLLSKIAPTVAQSGDYDDYGAPWDVMALTIGQAVGQPETMQAIIDDVKATTAEHAAQHPEFQGQSALCVTPYDGLFVYGPEDPRTRMLEDLGFTFAEGFTTADGEFGSSLSAERTADLDDVAVTVWIDLESDQAVKKVYEQTPTSFGQGRFFDVSEADGDYYVAHSFVTPLSIPYLLERYVPQLAAAVDGDPSTVPPEVTA
jgi:iron complex transport system substrate-binding protein